MPFVDVAGNVAHYELLGRAGAPVVMFANSLGTDTHMWDAQMPSFTERFRVLRYDLRGHGLSEPGTPVTIETLAGDAIGLLDALVLERVRFVGLSIGGLIGQHVAAAHPERVERLVLCATASRIGSAETWNARIATVRSSGIGAIAEAGLARWFTGRTLRERPALARGFATMMQRTSVDGYVAGCAAVRDADLRADDARIACPTLVVAGDADPVTTPAMGADLRDAIRGARLVVLEDAAHILNAERPAAFDAAVLDFVEDTR